MIGIQPEDIVVRLVRKDMDEANPPMLFVRPFPKCDVHKLMRLAGCRNDDPAADALFAQYVVRCTIVGSARLTHSVTGKSVTFSSSKIGPFMMAAEEVVNALGDVDQMALNAAVQMGGESYGSLTAEQRGNS
ncbi:MAG: hypothetical protein K2Q20_07855 [Phycisphaerales bacterium]|nr:hypothetical protein [Phycisphaerales bacterium]